MTGVIIDFKLGVPICAIPEYDMYNSNNLRTSCIYYNNGYKIGLFTTNVVIGIFSVNTNSATFRIWYI